MKLFNCKRCTHHIDKTQIGIICAYYSDDIVERTLINYNDDIHSFILDCPISSKIVRH